jgi:hypothetical protein
MLFTAFHIPEQTSLEAKAKHTGRVGVGECSRCHESLTSSHIPEQTSLEVELCASASPTVYCINISHSLPPTFQSRLYCSYCSYGSFIVSDIPEQDSLEEKAKHAGQSR